MTYFKDADELRLVLGALYDRIKCDAQIAPRIAAGRIVIRFSYTQPHGIVTINAAAPATQPGAFCDVFWGDNPLKPDVELAMPADVAHRFWHGKVNLVAALARREMTAQGPIAKILKLLPAVAPVYTLYPVLLREVGRSDLVLAE
jgi:hypothetical protein